MLEGVLDQADVHVARVLAGGQLVDAQGAHDGGVDRELIDVDLGEDRVEVHEGARDRDIEGQDALDLGVGVPEDVLGHDVDRGGLGALGDADGEGLLVDVQHVAALGVELAVAAEVQRDVLVVGVVLEDVLAVQGLAVAGDRVHAVEVDALADDRERVAGEVEVGHRVDDQVGLGLGVDQGVEGRGRREGHVDLGLGHAGHGLLDELEVVLDGVQLLADDLRHVLAADAGLGDVLVGELGAGAGDLVEHLGDEVLEIEDLHALVPQDLGEGVVLLLRDLQERDVVEQESLELVGRQVEELVAGTVQADLPELADLGRHVQTFRHGLLPFFRALVRADSLAPLRVRRYC